MYRLTLDVWGSACKYCIPAKVPVTGNAVFTVPMFRVVPVKCRRFPKVTEPVTPKSVCTFCAMPLSPKVTTVLSGKAAALLG